MLLVDVRARALLARDVARPGERELGEVAENADRSLGPITTIVEGGASGGPEPLFRSEAQAADSSTPIVPGEQETAATVSVTFSLR